MQHAKLTTHQRVTVAPKRDVYTQSAKTVQDASKTRKARIFRRERTGSTQPKDETRSIYAVRKNGVDASSSRSARTARGSVQVVRDRGLPQRRNATFIRSPQKRCKTQARQERRGFSDGSVQVVRDQGKT